MSKVANQIKQTATSVRSRIQRRSKPTLSFPLRSLSNVKYHPKKGFLELKGKKKIRTLTVATVKTFAQTLRMMSQAKTIVEDNEIMTKREAYAGLKLLLYSSPKRPNSCTFQRAFLLCSSVLQRSYARLTSANCLGKKIWAV